MASILRRPVAARAAALYALGIGALMSLIARNQTSGYPIVGLLVLDGLISKTAGDFARDCSSLGFAAYVVDYLPLSGGPLYLFYAIVLAAAACWGRLSARLKTMSGMRRATLRRFLEAKYSPSTNSEEDPTLEPLYLLIVLGSGGHTKEMLIMMERGFGAYPQYHRRYLVSSGDHMSLKHVAAFESGLLDGGRDSAPPGSYDVLVVPRARRVHQSLLTTPISATRSILAIFPALLGGPGHSGEGRRRVPDVVVTNGPATGFFVCLAAFMLRLSGIVDTRQMRTIFIESWARIKSLSLTGKLLYYTGLADLFLVQHEHVARRYNVLNAGWLVLERTSRAASPRKGDAG